jgi:transcriptional regulator with XRE-family HTH domain
MPMDTYRDALGAFLKLPGNDENSLAGSVGCTQATINRYRHGKRFPDAETARSIDRATEGAVPFALWQAEFLQRSGLDAAA